MFIKISLKVYLKLRLNFINISIFNHRVKAILAEQVLHEMLVTLPLWLAFSSSDPNLVAAFSALEEGMSMLIILDFKASAFVFKALAAPALAASAFSSFFIPPCADFPIQRRALGVLT